MLLLAGRRVRTVVARRWHTLAWGIRVPGGHEKWSTFGREGDGSRQMIVHTRLLVDVVVVVVWARSRLNSCRREVLDLAGRTHAVEHAGKSFYFWSIHLLKVVATLFVS